MGAFFVCVQVCYREEIYSRMFLRRQEMDEAECAVASWWSLFAFPSLPFLPPLKDAFVPDSQGLVIVLLYTPFPTAAHKSHIGEVHRMCEASLTH